MESTAHHFKSKAINSLHNERLQQALARTKSHFIDKRLAAIKALPEFDALRQRGRDIKDHTLKHLDFYLEYFEQQVIAQGGQVHWADTPKAAREQIISICKTVQAKRVTKGKSMVTEEIDLNHALEQENIEVVETDLGEYIIQLAKEPPSHIIAPAVHKSKEDVAELFHTYHQQYGFSQRLTQIPELVNEARQVLREKFLTADVGITGANFLIAETGSSVIVTNEGNGDLTNTLPRVHIVVAGIEKLVPTLEEATVLIRLLARSATGQEITSYTTFSTGPRRQEDLDGPQEFHVVLLDHGRSTMLGNEFHEILRCIRCGACLNHCPIYGSIGGHAYGWVYPGPMGSVLTPLMLGVSKAKDLPQASTLCGRCEEVCPMHIPLPKLLRFLRIRQHRAHDTPARTRWLLSFWAFFARHSRLYHAFASRKIRVLHWLGRGKGVFHYLPFAAPWTTSRDMPVPERATTFLSAWRKNHESNP